MADTGSSIAEDATGRSAARGATRREDELAGSLPGALSAGSRQGDRLAEALRPVVERSVTLSARQPGSALVPPLSRLIGPVLRRWRVEKARRVMVRMNRFVLRYLSPRGWGWRVEALRAGRSFDDILAEKLRTRRVKQIFLIHRETGLLLQSVTREDARAMDGDMVSAMLTAIRDFVRDSFGAGRAELESIRVGSTAVWIEPGPLAVLAAVIEGETPAELRAAMESTIESVHTEFGPVLSRFDGDTRPFASAAVPLDACARTRLSDEGERMLPLTWAVLTAPVVAAILLAGLWLRDEIVWRGYVREIARQPGLVVIEAGRRGTQFYIRGLRDPMAIDPASILGAGILPRERVISEWASYQALLPEMILLRARQALAPPASVSLQLRDGTLVAQGTASREWVAQARRVARLLPGVTDLRVEAPEDQTAHLFVLWQAYVRAARAQPGFVVIEEGERDGRFRIVGLRDPDAADPRRLLEEVGLDAALVDSRWETYSSGDPRLVLSRARRLLRPPAGMVLRVEDGVLIAEGEASGTWVEHADLLARTLTGISAFDAARVRDTDMMRLLERKKALEELRFRFSDQGTDLWPDQGRRMDELVSGLAWLQERAFDARTDLHMKVLGYATGGPDEEVNRQVSTAVARRFLEMLERLGVDTRRCQAEGMGSAARPLGQGEETGLFRRCVRLAIETHRR
jgi:hypothetical protein